MELTRYLSEYKGTDTCRELDSADSTGTDGLSCRN